MTLSGQAGAFQAGSAAAELPNAGDDALYVPYSADGRMGMPVIEYVLRTIWAAKWIILAITGACLAAGLLLTLLATPRYTARSLIEISRQQANIAGVEAVEEADRSRDQEFYDTQYSLLEAQSLAERVARVENLVSNDEFFEMFGAGEEIAGFGGSDGSAALNASERAERLRVASDILLENASIDPVLGSSLVHVGFTSADPELSTRIANAWVEQFIDANLDRRFGSTQDAREFLEDQLEELRRKLEESERQLVGYASDKEIVALSRSQDETGRTRDNQTLVTAELTAMNAALAEARADRIAAQSALQRNNGAREMLGNLAVNGLREKRAEAAAERASLLTTFEPGYPAVEALASQIAQLDSSIEQEEMRIRDASSSSYAEAAQKERELERQVRELKGQYASQNRDSIQYNIYQREVDTNRELYNSLLQRYKEIGVAGVGTNNVAIVDRAQLPTRPSSPNVPLNLALALGLGLAISGAWLFAREQIDQTLRDPADTRKLLGLTALGTIPHFGDDGDLLESLQDAKSVTSEAYFSIGTSLSFLTGHGVPRSMLLTSSQPNEGKTTSSLGLAYALARTGKRVLLIDADMRNPSLHKFIDRPNALGLSNYLAGDDDVARLIHETARPGLSVMTAGPIPPNPAQLLTGDRLGQLTEKLMQGFEHVIFDAPPVLGIADVPLIASQVEGLIYTIEANRAKLRTIESALRRVRDSKARLFGAIITKLDARNSAYGYGYGYGYGYSYGGSNRPAAEA